MSLDLIDICICRSDSKAALFAPISLHIPAGEVACVMGPSGVGKSTLLDGIGGHLAHDFKMRGRVLLEGRDVTQLPPETRRIGLMFQDALLFPHLSLGAGGACGALCPRSRHPVRRATRPRGLDADPVGRAAGAAAGRTILET